MAEIRKRRYRAHLTVAFSTQNYPGPSEDFTANHALERLERGLDRTTDLGINASRPLVVERSLEREPLSVYDDVPCLVCDAETEQACTEFNGELRNVPHPTRADHLALRRRQEGWE